ncbi:hypothetical protein C8J56DRAFT_813047 [Mycena floridula]|nr:hypothetical protein C8J56DRAFT_813047 [Mycena floridula]
MALTQSARNPGPSWDEEVVPALRQRLQSESRTLSRRLSSIEDPANPITMDSGPRPGPAPISDRQNNGRSRPHETQPARANNARKPSAVRTRTMSASLQLNGQVNEAFSNSRSYSGDKSKDNLPLQGSDKSSSPRIPATRIPKATRSRAGSSAGYGYSAPALAVNVNGSPQDSSYPNTSRSTVSISQQDPGLLNEPPPSAMYSSHESSYDELPSRPSNDSEEHPFEHWYRGEVSRNGGVGELKVGKRNEMLDIANYGHRAVPLKRNAITDAIAERRGRGRAGSLGHKDRESFYMDEERAAEAARVLDEAPLTDFEGENSDVGYLSDYYGQQSGMDVSSSSAPAARATTPTELSERTPTPTPKNVRGMSEPPFASSSSTPRKPQQQQRSVSANSTPPAKRATSPAAPSSKKAKTTAAKATRAKLEAARKQEDNRRSVAYYPTPEDGLESAIPQWTQPVRADGNWDDVVLPVVARKQGLEGYEQTDGSPRPKKPERVEPAPGTFGYDHSKYRPPRAGDEFSPVPFDEFGRPTRVAEEDNEEPDISRPPISIPHDEIRVGSHGRHQQSPSSPVPFSHYASPSSAEPKTQESVPQKVETKIPQKQEEEDGAGCCKCVVM